MGWTSTGDPLESVGRASLLFRTSDEAVAFAVKSGWAYEVAEPQPKILSRPKRFNQYGARVEVAGGGDGAGWARSLLAVAGLAMGVSHTSAGHGRASQGTHHC
jgi:hypothetical protein